MSPFDIGYFSQIQHYFMQHVTEPTRGTAYLDLIITRDPDAVDDMNVLGRFGTSDHYIVVCQLMFGKVVLDTEHHLLDYNKGDFSRPRIMAQEVVWDKMVGSSASLSWDYLTEAVQSVLYIEGTCVPIRVPDTRKKKALWLDKKVMETIKHKKKVYSRYKNADLPAYVEAARLARLGMKTARKNLEKKLACNVKENIKSFYAYI